MKIIILIIINITLYAQNFIYDENDWIIISNPGFITSMTYKSDEVIFTSSQGVFSYNLKDNSLSFMHEFLRDMYSNNNLLIHCDTFRDYIWYISNQKIFFKSYISSIWRQIDFYELGITSFTNIKNIGSNSDFIFIKYSDYIITVNPYTGEKVENPENIYYESINWSSTYNDINPNNIQLNNFFSNEGYNVLSNDIIEYKGNYLYINGIIKDYNGDVWVGTNSGQLFKCDMYTKYIYEIKNIPYLIDFKLSYLDEYSEWWFASKDMFYINENELFNHKPTFLSHWNENKNKWMYYGQNEKIYINSFDINDIFRFRNNLYIGTNYGCFLFDVQNKNWNTLNDITGNDFLVNDVEYYNNKIYLASSKGVLVFSIANNVIIPQKNLKLLDNVVVNKLEVYSGSLFIASLNGLFKYQENQDKIISISKESFHDIISDNKVFYAVTNNKLYEMINDNIEEVKSIKNITTISLCDNFIWMNQISNAILFDLKENRIFNYNYLDGIPGNQINHVDCDNEWVWFSTDKGLALYNWGKYHIYEN